MKKVAASTLLIGMLLGPVGSSLAAAQARQDNSGIVVWAFLGICALIVIAQLVPAIMVMLGLVKGVTEKKDQAYQRTTR